METWWLVIALVLVLVLLLIVIWLCGHISIIIYFIRDNKDEKAEFTIKGWGFSFTYQTMPSLLISQYQNKWPNPLAMVTYFSNAVGLFMGNSHWEKMKVSLSWGTGDAASTAITVGIVRSIGANLWTWLKKNMNFTKEQPLLEFNPYYNEKKASVDLAIKCHISLFRIVIIGFYLLYHLKIKSLLVRRLKN